MFGLVSVAKLILQTMRAPGQLAVPEIQPVLRKKLDKTNHIVGSIIVGLI